MKYEEFRRNLGKARLTTKEFAELLRLNRSSITNCSQRGVVPSHLAVIAVLLGEMAEHRIDFRGVLSKVEIAPKKARGGQLKGNFAGRMAENDALTTKGISE